MLGVGVALAGLILVQGNHNARGLTDVRAEIADVRAELVDVRAELADVRERLARVETRLAIPATNDTSVAATTTSVFQYEMSLKGGGIFLILDNRGRRA